MKAIETFGSDLALVLTDIHMPECDGIEILISLYDRRFDGGVVLMSSNGVMLPKAARLASGFGLNLVGASEKPVAPEVITLAATYLCTQSMRRPIGAKTPEPFGIHHHSLVSA